MNDDEQIIALYWARNEAAIASTAEKYGHLCMSIALNILHNEQDAEECTNDTYLSLWNTIPPERPKSLTAYICRLCRNICLNRFDYNIAEKRRGRVVSLTDLAETLPDTSLVPMEDEELGAHLAAFLSTEKALARKVFIRHYYFSDGIADIAARYSLTETKVKSMLFRTRNRLKQYLAEKGVYL